MQQTIVNIYTTNIKFIVLLLVILGTSKFIFVLSKKESVI
jgi:hypothetical protein